MLNIAMVFFSLSVLNDRLVLWNRSVTMQAQKEAPADLQCKDKFLVQSVTVSPGSTVKDITAEMVLSFPTSSLHDAALAV